MAAKPGKKTSNAVHSAVARLLTPLARMLLRYGVPFGTFADIAKRVYIDVAMGSFTIPGRKPSISRASIITGLSRKEILRVRRLAAHSDAAVSERYNRATRVISGWVRDAAYADAEGRPAALRLGGAAPNFTHLVRKYSGDVPARAILDELLRVGAVEQSADGKIQLHERGYVPSGGEEDKLSILGNDVADLVSTIEHNLSPAPEKTRFQMKVAYDNLSRESMARFRGSSAKKAMQLLERLDKELAAMDRDLNPEAKGNGRMRGGISIYYFEEELSEGGEGQG